MVDNRRVLARLQLAHLESANDLDFQIIKKIASLKVKLQMNYVKL